MTSTGCYQCGPTRAPRTIRENSPVRSAQEQFNQTYSTLLYQLERSFHGHPSQIKDAVGTMYALRGQALALMKMPTSDGKTTAGPTFEYVPPGQRT